MPVNAARPPGSRTLAYDDWIELTAGLIGIGYSVIHQ